MKDVSFSPNAISFRSPWYELGKTSIDRRTLSLVEDVVKKHEDFRMYVTGTGKCVKISLPDLSSSGKKI